jgi:DNA (cytosine-5)-methyltransferase 1
MIHVGSLFSGIGGIELGLECTKGFKTIWFIENDDYCQRVLRKHWPEVPIYGNIKQIDFTELEWPEMLTGGFPCQPVSVAGKRKGEKDERWLWPEFARAIRQIRPRIILVENVPGILSRGFGSVLGDLASLGYDAEWNRVSASSVGALHRRERIFIVAYNDSGRLKESNLSIRQLGQDKTSTIFMRHGQAMADSERDAGSQCRENGRMGWLWKPTAENTRGQWEVEPDVGRVAHGISARVDRLRCLGNAVVPQVAQWIGEQILRRLE